MYKRQVATIAGGLVQLVALVVAYLVLGLPEKIIWLVLSTVAVSYTHLITKQTIDQMVDTVMALPERTRIQLLAPVVRGRKEMCIRDRCTAI